MASGTAGALIFAIVMITCGAIVSFLIPRTSYHEQPATGVLESTGAARADGSRSGARRPITSPRPSSSTDRTARADQVNSAIAAMISPVIVSMVANIHRS